MNVLDEVLARASADPGVLGVVLTGSRARGLQTARSDYDVTVVVASRPSRRRGAELDLVECTVEALADTSVEWARYGYRGAKVLLDRLDGRIATLVERQATLTPAEATSRARAALDAYVNQLYRCAKSRRDGQADAARLDEMESVPWLLETVFALHGRLRPYNKYLRWELDTYPLPDGWNAALAPADLPTAPFRLFAEVEALARGCGHADVLDGWGADLELLRAHDGDGSS
jgi:predicted nucleotidyltransferase